uniref:Uncharacterized protein n=1 Tax=Arundo donax TaxID=35708 RepID=A0A0A9ESM8_ARUDO
MNILQRQFKIPETRGDPLSVLGYEV